MNNILKGALIANAASLGYNWIYNLPYLERLEKNESLVFKKADAAKYKRARKAVLAYPFAEIGDVSLQGEIAKWLFQALKEDQDFSAKAYQDMVFEKIKPGGAYRGWIESYGKKLIFNQMIDDFELDSQPLNMDDDQLVGVVPYLVCKTLDLGNEKAWELAQVFTDNEDYKDIYAGLDAIFTSLDEDKDVKKALQTAIPKMPRPYGFKLAQAIALEDTKPFLMNYVKTSCSIKDTIPLAFHIISRSENYEAAVKMNTKIGGASSDRGMIIGAIYSQVSDIPKSWQATLNDKEIFA